ncbi:hypothetical protein BJY04DRAFT_218268 [Aspergillus karnatakaensis]|uniref:uncharacterized protein n=1 Tax=Aspergillus karnatakaensis TaxID=1810916 RepID=UPI003CCE4DB2
MDGRSYRRTRVHRAVGASFVSTFLYVLPIVGFGSAQVPYTPSSLLYSSQHNGSFAYLLQPADLDQRRPQFRALDVSESIHTSKPTYTILLDEVPFHTNNHPYVPVIDQTGVIKVYSGDCWVSGNPSTLWTFEPDPGGLIGNGSWTESPFYSSEGRVDSVTLGPGYLSAGFAYSASNMTDSSVFAFAGMCPYQSDSSISWITAANYSQTMTVLQPCEQTNCYEASNIGDRAPPIPEAGFTITPLQAAYGYADDGLRQQQDFLLIGGHTHQAFINMSELAIFSAPQNSWSFVTVESIADSSRNDLTFRDTAMIEPRSGHTAILSPDGSKVIVFGGWVGNTSVAAHPQLVVLEIGGAFIGSGELAWRVPSTSGGPGGSGLFGHGATMLPGGVMMIAGGYEIPQLTKRSGSEPQHNSQIYLYDVASDTWSPSYTNPYFSPTAGTAGGSFTTDQSSSSRKTGLGVGIGLGVPAAAGFGVIMFYVYRRRRLRRSRDNEIRKLALGAQRAHFWGRDSEMASSIRNPSMRDSFVSDYPWSSNNRPQKLTKKPDWHDNGEAAAERTGLLGDIHVPKRLNRPLLNAGLYRPPYIEYKRGDIAGNIHPIEEREEDEDNSAERTQTHDTVESHTEQAFVTARNTQVDVLRSPTGETETRAYLAGDERLSPDKDERTSSNLSDSSTSAKSGKSVTIPRTISNKLSIVPENGTHSLDGHVGHDRVSARTQDSAASAASLYEKRYSSDSYSTAHSTLSQRQAEGEHLLRDSSDNPELSPLGGLFRSKQPVSIRPKTSEWIGGIRRVLSVSRRRPPTNEGSSTISRASGIDHGGPASGVLAAQSKFPRRSVSASAELFRRKQGARDWGVGNRASHDTGFLSARSTRDDFGLDGHMDHDSDGDWDVEGAAEGRRVQVTFTVPREKLRVVNATPRDLDDLSVNSVSRSNSSS